MAAQKFPKKEGTSGGGMATEPGENWQAAVPKMAATRGSNAAHVHIKLIFKTRVCSYKTLLIYTKKDK